MPKRERDHHQHSSVVTNKSGSFLRLAVVQFKTIGTETLERFLCRNFLLWSCWTEDDFFFKSGASIDRHLHWQLKNFPERVFFQQQQQLLFHCRLVRTEAALVRHNSPHSPHCCTILCVSQNGRASEREGKRERARVRESGYRRVKRERGERTGMVQTLEKTTCTLQRLFSKRSPLVQLWILNF